MIGKMINSNVKEQVCGVLNKGTIISENTDPETLSELISALIVVHIKYWQFEDSIEEIQDLSTIGRLKKDTNSLFKVDRPELIKRIDGIILELLKSGEITDQNRCSLTSSISSNLDKIVSSEKFDLLYSDTLSELIDKIIIIQIRRWHIVNSLSEETSNHITLKLKTLDKDKIPMLIGCLDKLLVLIARGKVDFIPVNVKFYSGFNK